MMDTHDHDVAGMFAVWSDPSPFPTYRRTSLERPFSGSEDEFLAAAAVVMARHMGCVEVSIGRAEVGVVRLRVEPGVSWTELVASVADAESYPGHAEDEHAEVWIGSDVATAPNVALVLHLNISSGVLRATFDVDRIDAELLRSSLNQVDTVLAHAVADPSATVASFDIVDDALRAELLAHAGVQTFPVEPTIPAAVRRHVLADADAIAITANDGVLTYGQLRAGSLAIAGALRTHGVPTGGLVGVRLTRSTRLPLALLGVLEAGATYVPVDPMLPIARQQEICDMANLSVLLDATDKPTLDGVTTIALADAENHVSLTQNVGQDGRSAAYVLFTSGSTGRPKGVEVSHESVLRLVESSRELFAMSSEDVWLNAHNFAFDVSVWEIFGALTTGATVVIPSIDEVRDPHLLMDVVASNGISIMTTTPSAFPGFADAVIETAAMLPELRAVVFCGEALRFEVLAPWFAHMGDERPAMVNMYGITEATVHSSYYRIRAVDLRNPASRIGRGLPDTPIYVLDDERRLVPFGVEGEIYVGGPGVANRYLVASDRDHERFSVDPFTPAGRGVMYRSGDRGRWLQDGSIEYLGRRDKQVKIRGYRVELAEIERALLSIKSVSDARAWLHAQPVGNGSSQLMACVVAGDDIDDVVCREQVATRLPEYMVPARVVVLDHLPLTVNGKVDVSAIIERIPEPATVTGNPLDGELERLVAREMGALLDTPVKSGVSNFFEHGGDSISGVRLVARLRSLGYDMALSDLYRHRTVSGLAGQLKPVTSASTVIAPFSLVPSEDMTFVPEDAVDAYPVSRLQAGMFFHNLLDGEHVYHDLFTYAVDGRLDVDALTRTFAALAEEHVALRTGFMVDGPSRPLQIVRASVTVPLTVVDLSSHDSDEALSRFEAWADDERGRPFDWMVAPLLRGFVHLLPDGTSLISLSFHHSILDGWSVATLVTELLSRSAGSITPSLKRTDIDVVRAHVKMEIEAEGAESDVAFWRSYLADVAVPDCGDLHVPISCSPDDVVFGEDGTAWVVLDPSVVDRLRLQARDMGVSVKTLFLAGHIAALAIMSDRADVATAVIAGTRPEVDDATTALGLFLNATPVRMSIVDGSWRDLVARVLHEEIAVSSHRHHPFERMHSNGRRGSGAFPIAFNYTDFHVQRVLSEAVKVTGVTYREKTDFELLVSVISDIFTGSTSLQVSYRDGALSEERAAGMLTLFRHLMERCAAEPDTSIFDVVTGGAINIEPEVSGAESDLGERSCLSSIATRLVADPSRVVQRVDDIDVTASQFMSDVNGIRAAMASVGVGAGERVACMLPRGQYPAAALMACWSSGATYVPIELSLPRARQHTMLDAAACAAVLVVDGVNLPDDLDCPVVSVDRLEPGADSIEDWEVPEPKNEAYVLFTSGSTGVPKAVSMPHRAMNNLLGWQQVQPEFRDAPRVSQFASLSFDVSIQEMLAGLLTGCLVVVPEQQRLDPQALLTFFAKEAVDVAFLPVVALQQMAEAWCVFGTALPTTRTFVVAGEALVITDALRSMCTALNATVVNQYGPTETHVVSHHRLNGNAETWPQRPPIGRPVSNTAFLLLNAWGHPALLGAVAELYVTGDNVADGYLEMGDHQSFVTIEGKPTYRTGDLARRNHAGDIEYVGRNDGQVKIRGHRVEPLEVAAVIRQMPEVVSCAVVTVPSQSGGSTSDTLALAAYVKTRSSVDDSSVVRWCAERLPRYAVPDFVTLVDVMPLTDSGKIDRLALPAPARPTPASPSRAATPRETDVLAVWSDILGVPVSETQQTFFEVGGNSLLLLQLFLRLKGKYPDVEFALHDLFRHATVEQFASFLDVSVQFRATSVVAAPEVRPSSAPRLAARRRAARNKDLSADD